jgi:hypothetical protein
VALTSRRLGSLAASFALLSITACGPRPDPRLEKLTEGITQDSVFRVMGDTATRSDAFLMNGKLIGALYFARPGASDSASRTDRKMSPVVLVEGKVVGWGWETWDSVAAANSIRVPPKR